MYNFRNFSHKYPTRFSEAQFVTFHSPRKMLFFVEKRNLKLSDSKNVIERGKIFTLVKG